MNGINLSDAECAIEDPVATIALERFHIPRLAPLQRFAIANILEDARAAEEERATRRQLVLFPTGFGKSICFQLPALLLDGLSVVVYPLLALMNDQKRRLDEASLPCALFRGGLSDEEWKREEQSINSGKTAIVIANPEILATPKLQRFLSERKVAHLVIDEAHCIAEWGETFRPSYLELGEIAQTLAPSVLSAFTATAGPDIIASIEKKLFLANPYRMVSAEADRTNVLYGAVHTLSPTRTLRTLVLSCKKPAIIFERSRPGVKMKAEALRSNGCASVRFYHAGLSRKEREDIESWFQRSDDAVLVSTNAYGMGMDKKNIRTVIHMSLPDSPEAYIQEAGRGGRDGELAAAILIHDLGRDTAVHSGGEISEYARSRSARLAPYPALSSCRREFLLDALGEREMPVCGRCDNCIEGEDGDSLREVARELGRGAQGAMFAQLDVHILRAEGFLEALTVLGAHPRSFDETGLAEALAGKEGRGLGRRAILPGWSVDELRELIDGLVFADMISKARRGPWKGAIMLTDKGRLYYQAARKCARRT